MHQDQYEDDFKNITETLWGMEILHDVEADCWRMEVNSILTNRKLKLQINVWS